MVQEEIPFKGISYLDIWQPFCSAECNYLCNFGREYQQEQFCEIKSVNLFGILGSYLFLHILENILLKLGKKELKYMKLRK